MEEIRSQVTSDGIYTLFFGCVTISDLRPHEAHAFASARKLKIPPGLPRAMPLSFFVDLASGMEAWEPAESVRSGP
jgi:hypothetical protein